MDIKIEHAISKGAWNKRYLPAGPTQKGETLESYVKEFYLEWEQTKENITVKKSELNE